MNPKLILHIEDNPSNRKALRHILRMTNYRLIEAADGQEGIDLLEKETPDLILTDIQLPKLSGYDVAKRVKADPRFRHIPVVAVTSYGLSGDDAKAKEAGCDDYVSKPYRPKVLLEHLEKFLGSSRNPPPKESP
ncbi:MAG: histidine kinase [Candidatus Handelsmanbacteria bacterium RIFCSPLOWO2_12_FULL_64_10]|uniref:Histidine kinase n=1 Tax=Handelsmanbacteria sp. (strain RIFCSPLOWO2_12_FULL_64_10) TaxID=1817868 RepID=A0A1F6CD87_HANXR|nr:MAG: histidine kinase [Candidatus Handelsmanbacteria bacterium RIFCSPLOWO2_12_FULL_64_10]